MEQYIAATADMPHIKKDRKGEGWGEEEEKEEEASRAAAGL